MCTIPSSFSEFVTSRLVIVSPCHVVFPARVQLAILFRRLVLFDPVWCDWGKTWRRLRLRGATVLDPVRCDCGRTWRRLRLRGATVFDPVRCDWGRTWRRLRLRGATVFDPVRCD